MGIAYSLLCEAVELSVRARGHVEFWWSRARFFWGKRGGMSYIGWPGGVHGAFWPDLSRLAIWRDDV